jgi:nucleotide-binding universal stress UspA family protein
VDRHEQEREQKVEKGAAMIERILFPTDGSELSDRALPALEQVASAQNAEVHLVQVVSPPVWTAMGGGEYGTYDAVSPELYEQIMNELDEQARRNMGRIEQRLQAHQPPISSRSELFHGSTYAALLDEEAQVRPGLVVMATHGRTGLDRFVRGSVADAMVREGTSPVLMVPSFGSEASTLRRALVPLDGSAVAEQALSMVETLAQKPLQGVHLLDVVDDVAETDQATAYLKTIAPRLEAAGLTVTAEVRTGAPGDVIPEAAKLSDLVIMATHGRGGLNRLRHGSVAEQTLRDVTVPLLLVRAAEAS